MSKKMTAVVLMALLLTGCADAQLEAAKLNSPTNIQKDKKEETKSGEVTYGTIKSKVLQKEMSFSIYLPKGYEASKKYPVLYMFHGFGGNHNDWFYGCRMNQTYERLQESNSLTPAIIVCPNLENSYGLNSGEGPAKIYVDESARDIILMQGFYEDYFIKELMPYIESHYGADSRKEKRYIGGFSMGAHIAIRLGMTYPEYFGKVGGHAPSVRESGVEMSPVIQKFMYPTQEKQLKYDPVQLAKNLNAEKLKETQFYLDIGSEDMEDDARQKGTEEMVENMKKQGIPVSYHLNSGEHNFDYLMAQMENYLNFYFK